MLILNVCRYIESKIQVWDTYYKWTTFKNPVYFFLSQINLLVYQVKSARLNLSIYKHTHTDPMLNAYNL